MNSWGAAWKSEQGEKDQETSSSRMCGGEGGPPHLELERIELSKRMSIWRR